MYSACKEININNLNSQKILVVKKKLFNILSKLKYFISRNSRLSGTLFHENRFVNTKKKYLGRCRCINASQKPDCSIGPNMDILDFYEGVVTNPRDLLSNLRSTIWTSTIWCEKSITISNRIA